MTIEVRQLLIRSQVNPSASQRPLAGGLSERDTERLKRELLAACMAWLSEKLQAQRER
ncbi:MAG TPA: DUF5908 family protein [Burkholderiaceae bacterium]|nr:DUF5908 family protein [Burkholderiaceae bacterium]